MYLQTTIRNPFSEEDAEEFYRHYADVNGFKVLGQVIVEWQYNLYAPFPDAFVRSRVRRK